MNTVYAGAGVAAALGLLMGAVWKPDFGQDNRPAGPQVVAGWTGVRSTGPFDDGATFAAYKGHIPDYVLGTDFQRAMSPPQEKAYVARPMRLAKQTVDEPDPPLTDGDDADEVPVRASYPSVDGGRDAAPQPDEPSAG